MRILLSVTILFCAAIPALAQPACNFFRAATAAAGERYPGQSRSVAQAAVSAAKGFMAESEVYQNCLIGALDAAKTQAGADGQPLDPALESQMRLRLAANQKTKEKVGTEINTAIDVS